MSQTDQPARPQAADPWTPAPAPSRRRRGRAVAAAVGGLVVAASLTVGALRLVHLGEVLPGVAVDGVEVGGLGRADTREVLASLVAARRDEPVTFTFAGREFSYVPGEETYGADLDAAVDAAMAVGRDDDVLTDSWWHVAAVWPEPVDVKLADEVDRGRVEAFVSRVVADVDAEPFPGRVSADPETLEVRVEQPTDGQEVRRDDAVELALAAIRDDGPDTVALPVDPVPHRVRPESVRRVASQARRALEEPAVLTADHVTVVLEPEEVAPLISSRAVERDGDRVLTITVPVGAVEEAFDEDTVEDIDIAPRDADFRVLSGFTTFDDKGDTSWTPRPAEIEVVPSEDGVAFDAELTARQLTAMFRRGVREAPLELRVVAPDLTTAQARDLRIDSLIGTFTTYHRCCQPRVTNIHRMADIIRGTVVLPGEEFAINDIVGERTRAKGFVADGTIVNGEFVDEVGGGVSQFATTAFNAGFFAGMDFEQFKAHSYYISRYPMGREATIYFPYLDMRWRNTTGNGVYVHASYTDTSITVSLFGDNGGKTVRAEHGEPFNFRGYRTTYRENNALPQGSSRVVQSGDGGFDVIVHRVVDGERERFYTRYEAQPRIVERNT